MYNKLFFFVYVNFLFFVIVLILVFIKYFFRNGVIGLKYDILRMVREYCDEWKGFFLSGDYYGNLRYIVDREWFLVNDEEIVVGEIGCVEYEKFNFWEMMMLSLEFMVFWVLVNYFVFVCFEYISVFSVMILIFISSMWMLIFGVVFGVEFFIMKKFMGVLVFLMGIIFILMVDFFGESDENWGIFLYKLIV